VTELVALGVVVAAFGLALALNMSRLAETMAAWNRPFPWWVKWPLSDDPAGYRIAGACLAAAGAVFVVVAVRPG